MKKLRMATNTACALALGAMLPMVALADEKPVAAFRPSAPDGSASLSPRWSVEKAKAWGAANPWWCGVNYIPANAVNYTAMWDKTSFSPDVIRRELKLMTGMGMNCVRFVM